MHQLVTQKTVWKYKGESASWYFVSFPILEIDTIRTHIAPKRIGWGQIPVTVTIGQSTWQTSLFPLKERGYDLPIKAIVRKKEGIAEKSTVDISIQV